METQKGPFKDYSPFRIGLYGFPWSVSRRVWGLHGLEEPESQALPEADLVPEAPTPTLPRAGTLRVQVPNNHILTQNLYYNYYYPKPFQVPNY